MKYLNTKTSAGKKIIWLEHYKMGKCGIVDSTTILDEEGIELGGYYTFDILQRVFDQKLIQNLDNGTTTLQLENGRVVFEGSSVTYINDDKDDGYALTFIEAMEIVASGGWVKGEGFRDGLIVKLGSLGSSFIVYDFNTKTCHSDMHVSSSIMHQKYKRISVQAEAF